MYLQKLFLAFFSKATNLSSNSTLIGESQEPEENKVRSMAKQLLAKFENKPNYTLRRTQVWNESFCSVYSDFLLPAFF